MIIPALEVMTEEVFSATSPTPSFSSEAKIEAAKLAMRAHWYREQAEAAERERIRRERKLRREAAERGGSQRREAFEVER